MRYMQQLHAILYKFGNETKPVFFPELNAYVDILDQLKVDQSFYEDYTILSGDRPDIVSNKLYNNPDYYWTFYMLNDHLRESGWPVNREKLRDRVKERYPHRTVTTKDDFTTKPYDFPVGKVVTGSESGTVGKIIRRIPELGQLIIDTTNTTLDKTKTYTVDVKETGFGEISVDNSSTETFHSVDTWTFFRDGVIIDTTIERELDDLKKKATFDNIPFIENTTVTVTASYFEANAEDDNFGSTEDLRYIDETTGITIAITLVKESAQFDAVHHYEKKTYVAFDLDKVANILTTYNRQEAIEAVENADNAELRVEEEWVGIDPYTQVVGAGVLPVTVREHYESVNDDLKQIKVLKSDVIEEVASEVYRKLQEVI